MPTRSTILCHDWTGYICILNVLLCCSGAYKAHWASCPSETVPIVCHKHVLKVSYSQSSHVGPAIVMCSRVLHSQSTALYDVYEVHNGALKPSDMPSSLSYTRFLLCQSSITPGFVTTRHKANILKKMP